MFKAAFLFYEQLSKIILLFFISNSILPISGDFSTTRKIVKTVKHIVCYLKGYFIFHNHEVVDNGLNSFSLVGFNILFNLETNLHIIVLLST